MPLIICCSKSVQLCQPRSRSRDNDVRGCDVKERESNGSSLSMRELVRGVPRVVPAKSASLSADILILACLFGKGKEKSFDSRHVSGDRRCSDDVSRVIIRGIHGSSVAILYVLSGRSLRYPRCIATFVASCIIIISTYATRNDIPRRSPTMADDSCRNL